MLDVVESQDGIEQHERCVVALFGRFRVRRARPFERGLEPRGGVVTQKADGPADETRHFLQPGRAIPREQPSQRLQERLGQLLRPATLFTDGSSRDRPQHEKRILPEERVTRQVLATRHALEQEGVIGAVGHLEKGRHRREEVGQHFTAHRHERRVARQFAELVERRCSHRLPDRTFFTPAVRRAATVSPGARDPPRRPA